MDSKYLSNVIAEMKPFLDENGFKAESDGVFVSDTKKVAVEYNVDRQMFLLKVAVKEEETFGDLAEVNAWLFDDSQNEHDAESVGIDFVDTLRKNMGLKAKRVSGGKVELPTVSKNGALNVSGFAKKVLDVYPKFKEPYKEHIEKYGNFLYMNFFGETLIPEIVENAVSGNNKTKKKILDLFENAYIKGDKETVNIAVACLAAACYQDQNVKAAILQILGDNNHLKSCVESFIPMIANKKIKNTFIK
ncbi:MAG: hypothetical protein J6J13_03145 [Clostridia bacterium]|nr:hypothetical protein [Clostridia bacterium]